MRQVDKRTAKAKYPQLIVILTAFVKYSDFLSLKKKIFSVIYLHIVVIVSGIVVHYFVV